MVYALSMASGVECSEVYILSVAGVVECSEEASSFIEAVNSSNSSKWMIAL